MGIELKINKLRGLSLLGATTGNYFDDLNILKSEIEKISYELEELIKNQNKVFLIEAKEYTYDCFTEFAVVAKNENEARGLADKYKSYGDERLLYGEDIWLNKEKSTCEEIETNKKCVILSAFYAG